MSAEVLRVITACDEPSREHYPEGTRTLNLRIDRPSQTHVNPCKQRTPQNDLTLTCQVPPDLVISDVDLIKLIEKWPIIHEELRKAIMKIIS